MLNVALDGGDFSTATTHNDIANIFKTRMNVVNAIDTNPSDYETTAPKNYTPYLSMNLDLQSFHFLTFNDGIMLFFDDVHLCESQDDGYGNKVSDCQSYPAYVDTNGTKGPNKITTYRYRR